jgi:inhibitor of KinA sporulation pathway (predicted exonuclease)
MNILSLDCEYNQPSGKTIQIGAAVYTVNGVLLERFETYVNPGEPITQYITDLTGITDMNVSNAPNIKEAYEMLEYIHAKHKCFVNPLVWGSGTRNDSQMIYDESKLDRPNFMGYRVLDVKSIYQCINMVKGTTVRGGLESSCKKVGIGFEGKSHTALADAVNTFRLWQHLMKGFKNG